MSDRQLRREHAALTQGVGLVDLSQRSQIQLRGADRHLFLHNLCTNEIRKLAPGTGCEVFLLNVKGGVVGHGFVFCEMDRLLLETVPGQAERLLSHLDRYLMREQVELADVTAEEGELLLAGNQAADHLARCGLPVPAGRLEHASGELSGSRVTVRRTDLTLPAAFLLNVARTDLAAVRQALVATGATPCSDAAWEMARIEAGTPLFGTDTDEENLPQELARDARAISFVKGCYLGQETVARIDALGHVNKTLCGVRFASTEPPPAGTELTLEGKRAGRVTSSVFSPRLGSPLALAYVRRGRNVPGTQLDSSCGPATVVQLPL